MRANVMVALGIAFAAAAGLAARAPQATRPGLNLQAARDPRYAEVIAKCRMPSATGGGPGAAGRGVAQPGARRGAAPAAPTGSAEFTVTKIPGVIAADQRWTSVWQTEGNNADGVIASDDGGLLIAQNDNGVVLKLDAKGQVSVVYRDTNTGGALTMSSKGALFVASRGIGTAVLQLAPQRRVFANSYRGEPLECLGGVLNDVTADSKGGVYVTLGGGLYYADPKGVVTSYGENLRTNGVILSPDEKTVYVTNQASIAAFDVRPDGSLASQREFAKLPAGAGDGLAVDAAGRLYATVGGGPGGAPGLYVFAADGKQLGHIPSPRNLVTAAFSGPGKETLYAVANDLVKVDVYSIPMIAQGYTGRAK